MELRITSGSLQFETELGESLSFDALEQMLKSAKLLGVPKDALISSLSADINFAPNQPSRLNVYWRIDQ